MKNIVFFGDSLTAGYGLPAAESFPARIQEKLDATGLPYRAHNYGVSGETSAAGRQRLPAVLARTAPDVFVLALGANDGLRGIPMPQTVANLTAMLQLVRQQFPAAQLVLAGLEFPFELGPLGIPALAAYARQFVGLFGQVAQAEGVPLIPHLLADNMWAVLEPLLQRQVQPA